MRAKEFLVEYRDRMYQFLQKMVPSWPEYIVKDWLYANWAKPVGTGKPDLDKDFAQAKDVLAEVLDDYGLTVNSKWTLVKDMSFTPEMWDEWTANKLKIRAGGKQNPDKIWKDEERHRAQAELAKKEGGIRKEPVILVKTSKGYTLIEGWHRTIQHFNQHPNGYKGPAYIAVSTK